MRNRNTDVMNSPIPELHAFQSLRKINRSVRRNFALRPNAPKRSFHKRRHSAISKSDAVSIYPTMISLGHGDEGEVFQTVNQRGQVVALKKISVQRSSLLWKKFREYYYGSNLEHYAIVQYLKYVQTSKYEICFEIELCETSLAAHFRESPIPEDVVTKYFLDLLLGLEYIHSNGLVHLDLKPSNMLLTNNRTICKIADLGLMITPREWGEYVSHGGAGNYLAPECVEDCSTISPAVDIYSLGVVIMQLLLDVDVTNWNKVISEVPWEEFPTDYRYVLQSMLAEHPGDRPSCLEILHGFQRLAPVARQYGIEIPVIPSTQDEPIPPFSTLDSSDYLSNLPTPRTISKKKTKRSFDGDKEVRRPSKMKPTNRILFT
eukprot:TRINITY_DN1312_c0_g1_i1.p1 TRINITY_DN1312_c0_g1~~TRINITY_DN1312_c0_g1_i1.p1  ORF type:complete len:375 (+),score=73.61 TRINITY_DN1312_c0_g1_i1:922-2046(+)